MFKVYIYVHVYKGKCLQFSAGDDGVPRRNGLEPVKVRKKELAVSTLAQYISMFTLTMVSRCIRHLMEYHGR